MPKEDHSIFSNYCSEWRRQQEGTVRTSSYAKYSALVEKYIMPVLGKCQLSELSSEQIAQFAQKKRSRKSCPQKRYI